MRIGITGLAASGKDTAAEILSEISGIKVARYAAPLKQAALFVFGSTFDNRDTKEVRVPFYGTALEDRAIEAAIELGHILFSTERERDEFAERFMQIVHPQEELSPREFQQLVGTECARAVSSTVFKEYLKRTHAHAIIPDVRFEEEADAMDWLIVIDRDVPKLNHPSEDFAWNLIEEYLNLFQHYQHGYYDHCDIMNSSYINNNGTIQELRTKLEAIWKSINWR
ncbi:hypothetical protein [Bacillus sp. AP50]|uniref:hypothetical protein n=1 Tax=Bacillus sp. AP50 TaxID=3122950 RepID=UPI00339AA657